MGLTASDSGNSDFKSVEPGTYPATCFRLIDLGTQQSEYQGKPIVKKQVLIAWELPTEIIEEGDFAGQPYGIGKFYTISLHEKSNLRKDLESWRGRSFTAEELEGFDLRNILGKPCLVSVIHNDKGNARVSGVMALPKGSQKYEQINESQCFDVDQWDQKLFENLPEGIQKIIKESDEYKVMSDGGPVDRSEESPMPEDDDIPF